MCKNLCELWALIEYKAFNPRQQDRRKWLSEFHKFLPQLWRTTTWGDKLPIIENNCFRSDRIPEPSNEEPKKRISLKTISCKPNQDAQLGFSYSIEDNDIDQTVKKFDIQVYWRDTTLNHESAIQFGYDSKYVCEYKLHDKLGIELSKNVTKNDIKKLFEDRIVHPALHHHIQDSEDSLHEFRFGLACINPFVTLYQIALQVCQIFDKEESSQIINAEIEIISKIISDNLHQIGTISPGVLFSRKYT